MAQTGTSGPGTGSGGGSGAKRTVILTDQPQTEAAAQAAAETATLAQSTVVHPIVIDLRRKKKRGRGRKKKYTRGLKDVQRLEQGLADAWESVAVGLSAGAKSFRRRNDRSAYRKRDGVIRDGLENWTYGLSRTLRRAADAPYQVARKTSPRLWWLPVRSATALATAPFSFFLR